MNHFTGIMEPAEEPEQDAKPDSKALSQMTEDFAAAEQKTKAFLDGVHVKERRYLEAYDLMRKELEDVRSAGQRQLLESYFDRGHVKTVEYRDEELRNRDTAIQNTWKVFSETWPSTTCKLTTGVEEFSGKTYRTVEIESPYLGKRVIGPTNLPQADHLVDESKGGFRALARQPQGFLPQSYTGGPPTGFGHPPWASGTDSHFGAGYRSSGQYSFESAQYSIPQSAAPRCNCRGAGLLHRCHHDSGWGPM